MYLHLLHPLLHISILTLPLPTFSLPNPITSPQSTPHTVSTLHEFSPGTWVENLAVRSTNNHILTTFVSAPQVVQLSPSSPIPPQTIATFPGYTSTLGIIEAERDIFYVVAGNFSLKTFTPTIGSWSVFRLDFRDCDPQSHHPNNNNNNNNNPSSAAKNSAPKITKIADFPTAGLLNGLAILPSPSPSSHPHPNHPNPPYKILIADSNLGAIYTLNPHPPHQITHTLTHPLLSPNASATPRIGINGLHVNTLDKRLYFTNTNQALLASVPLSLLSGEGKDMGGGGGEGEEGARVEARGVGGDDFAFADAGEGGEGGEAFVAVGNLDELVQVKVSGAGGGGGEGGQVVVANITAGPTSVRFARDGNGMGGGDGSGKGEMGTGRSVFVTSNGGVKGYLPGGMFAVGGRVSRVVLG